MKHDRLSDEQCERAALYALGALDGEEADDFERHLAGGCPTCQGEVTVFAATARTLAFAAAPREPRPTLRTRLVAASGTRSSFHFVLEHEGEWIEIGPGVLRKAVADEAQGSYRSYLIRMAAGSTVAAHQHAGVEHCHVLAGDLYVAGRRLHEGDYHRAAPGSTHDGIRSDAGCLLLIVETPA